MRHLKKFENFDFQKEEELVVPADVVNNEDELCPECKCKPCECDEHDDEEDAGADEDNHTLEKFSAFNEKKASPAQLAARKAFADRIKGKSDKKDDKKEDKKDDKKEDDAKGKTPKTKKEKEFAALAEPKDKITFADKIAGAKKKKEDKK